MDLDVYRAYTIFDRFIRRRRAGRASVLESLQLRPIALIVIVTYQGRDESLYPLTVIPRPDFGGKAGNAWFERPLGYYTFFCCEGCRLRRCHQLLCYLVEEICVDFSKQVY